MRGVVSETMAITANLQIFVKRTYVSQHFRVEDKNGYYATLHSSCLAMLPMRLPSLSLAIRRAVLRNVATRTR